MNIREIQAYSEEDKKQYLIEHLKEFSKGELGEVASSLSVDSLIELINNYGEILREKGIQPYMIVSSFSKEKQLEFVLRFEDMRLGLEDERKILVKIDEEVKEKIDTTKWPEEYKSALKLKVHKDLSDINSYGKIIVDFSEDLEVYRGLDDLIYINGVETPTDDIRKIIRLCKMCPRMTISDNMSFSESLAKEYINSEAWIEEVLEGIEEDWNDLQKIAYIDNAIGKKISYSPDFDTEVFDADEARSLWKIVDFEYGVCNGIAQLEKHMLSRCGIESEMVDSKKHSFLRIKNIEMPGENGETVRGDTLLDGTWNLAAHRYGCYPENFCVSYEEIRRHDIRESDGKDFESHKNDENLSDVILGIDEETLRKTFASIGIAKENRTFPNRKFCKEIKIYR